MNERLFSKREFLATTLGAGIGLGLSSRPLAARSLEIPGGRDRVVIPPGVRRRAVVTTPLFKSPPGFPNALDVDPDGQGLWIGEQKMSGQNAVTYQVPEPADLRESAWLVDWNGKLLKTVVTDSRNTSGMAVGGGYVWMVANAAPNGVFQVDMSSRLISHRQIPLGGGGCHGAKFVNGKLWIASTRLRAVVRVDAQSWIAEYVLPLSNWDRMHDIAFDDEGALWVITGTNNGTGWEDDRAGIAKYNANTGRMLEYAEFSPENADPHGLAFHDGKLYSCDAGIHPGWPTNVSKTAGYIFRIEIV